MKNPFVGSDAALKVAETQRIFCTDRDYTFNFEKPSRQGQYSHEWLVELEKRGSIIEQTAADVQMVVTQCTPGMLMRRKALQASCRLGYLEPIPKLGFAGDGKTRIPTPPDDLSEYSFGIDWDVIGGVGTRAMLRHGEVYLEDVEYADQLEIRNSQSWSDSPWREKAIELLIKTSAAHYRAPIDLVGAYDNDKVDVACLPGRIQLNFPNREEKLAFMQKVESLQKEFYWKNIVGRLELVDESNPAVDPPTFQLYMLPKGGTKRGIIDRVIGQLALAANVELSRIYILFAGDAPPDLDMLRAVPEARATFILVGGSRLYPFIADPECVDFAGMPIGDITKNLRRTGDVGVYTFNTRTVIIGDEAYPGLKGPATIAAYLETR